jgi:hypothetical protein
MFNRPSIDCWRFILSNSGVNRVRFLLFAAFLSLILPAMTTYGQLYRPERELRTVNTDAYEVAVQKNGMVNVLDLSGAFLFRQAHPLVWFEGEDAPEALPIDGRRTARIAVHDVLGQGKGLLFKQKTCEWLIHTYLSKPFLVVQVAYVNTGKKAVRVKALAPWAIAAPSRRGTVPQVTQPPPDDAFYAFLKEPPGVVAGFLTEYRAHGVVVEGENDAGMAAWCLYDPPIEVLPGQTLTSEQLYLSVAETDPAEGPQRYGYAMALVNGAQPLHAEARHGWQIGSPEDPADQKQVLDLMEHLRDLQPFGWRNITIGPGWRAPGTQWTPDPIRFPEGFEPLTQRAHELGFQIHLWVDPFVVPPDDPLAAAHPEWLQEVAPGDTGGATLLVLNVARPEAYEHVRQAAHRVVEDWGFDGLQTTRVPHPLLLLDPPTHAPLSRREVVRQGLQALREGLGDDAYLATTSPFPAAAGLAQGKIMPDGARMTGWFLHPWVYAPVYPAVRLDLPAAEIQAQLFSRALAGGSIVLQGDPASMTPDTRTLLQTLLPAAPHAFRPYAPFEQDAGPLHVFSYPGPSFQQVVASLQTPQEGIPIDLNRLGSPPGYHLVYAPATGAYLGRATETLSLPASPGIQMIGLRPDSDSPVVLGVNRGIAGGYPLLVDAAWDAERRVLAGTVETIAGFLCQIDCFAPQGFEAQSAVAGSSDAQVTKEGARVSISFIPAQTGKTAWRVQF